MSLPGCADQTIHADTAHLFVHTQLPGHYYNLFMPAVANEAETSHAVGQTAFVLGTHVLKSCAHVMTQEGGHEQLLQRLVRPHLSAGDALVFDCRLLHFGLANQTNKIQGATSADEGVWRPLLYVNYHQSFFHDPKNWHNRDRLF
jgi:ectoine hydroxylase-related dioxygenase (phytanoyl-CoA dioxygenase family)